jgi:uncharacterized membrane protein (GlpM family)
MFTLQVIISFFVGGAFIALQTLLGERVPLYWRGTVLTLPSTMAVSFLFIGLTKSPDAIPEVAEFFPAAIAIGFIFVVTFTLLSRHVLPITLAGAYLAWAICAWVIVSFPPHTFVTAVVLYALPIILACYFCIKHLPHSTEMKRVPFNLKHFTIRSVIGGSIIALAVILSNALGNTFGSLFSAFPAGFSATLLIYTHVHSKQIIPAVARSLFFPGPIALILYAGIAGLTFPTVGVWYGTVICYLGVLAFYLLRLLVESKFLSKTATPIQ